jgi:hypothetical protein
VPMLCNELVAHCGPREKMRSASDNISLKILIFN